MGRNRRSKKRRLAIRTVFILFLIVGGFFAYLKLTENNVPPPEGIRPLAKDFNSHGIDVSRYQGKVDWEVLFSNSDSLISFVYFKATEGSTLIDPQFKRNLSTLREMEIPLGAYHYFKPNLSAVDQAQHFLKVYLPGQDDLPPVLDVEEEGTDDEGFKSKVQLFLEIVENTTGRQPIIYTNYYLYSTKLQSAFSDYKFWIANYSDKAERMDDDKIICWQYSDRGKLPGIEGFVDLNMSKIKF